MSSHSNQRLCVKTSHVCPVASFIQIIAFLHSPHRFIDPNWVKNSKKPDVNTDNQSDYGYLWWLPKFGPEKKRYDAAAMFGNGGNKVVIITELDLAEVLTNRMYGRSEGHQQTERLMNEFIVPAVIAD